MYQRFCVLRIYFLTSKRVPYRNYLLAHLSQSLTVFHYRPYFRSNWRTTDLPMAWVYISQLPYKYIGKKVENRQMITLNKGWIKRSAQRWENSYILKLTLNVEIFLSKARIHPIFLLTIRKFLPRYLNLRCSQIVINMYIRIF